MITSVPSGIAKIPSSSNTSDWKRPQIVKQGLVPKPKINTVRDRTTLFRKERGQARTYLRNSVESSPAMRDSNSFDIEMGPMNSSVKTKLISEEGSSSWIKNKDSFPEWVRTSDDVKIDFKQIKEKIADLRLLHKKHLSAAFQEDKDDNIEMLTSEITSRILKTQKKVKSIISESERQYIKNNCQINIPNDRSGSRKKEKEEPNAQDIGIKRNVQKSLTATLARISSDFRSCQEHYLQKLKSKTDMTLSGEKNRVDPIANLDSDFSEFGLEEAQVLDKGFSSLQLKKVDDMEAEETAYTEGLRSAHKSVTELHELFSDMHMMVDEQGTVLDQIDFLIENVQYNVEAGNKELVQALDYQKKTGTKMCMLLLVIAIFGLVIVLIMRIVL